MYPRCTRCRKLREDCCCSHGRTNTATTPTPPRDEPPTDAQFDKIMADPSRPCDGHHTLPYWVYLSTALATLEWARGRMDMYWANVPLNSPAYDYQTALDARIAELKKGLEG